MKNKSPNIQFHSRGPVTLTNRPWAILNRQMMQRVAHCGIIVLSPNTVAHIRGECVIWTLITTSRKNNLSQSWCPSQQITSHLFTANRKPNVGLRPPSTELIIWRDSHEAGGVSHTVRRLGCCIHDQDTQWAGTRRHPVPHTEANNCCMHRTEPDGTQAPVWLCTGTSRQQNDRYYEYTVLSIHTVTAHLAMTTDLSH